MRFILIGLGALALAGPAAAEPGYTALYSETVPGAGLGGVAGATYTIVRHAAGHGTVAAVPFALSKARVVYGRFHSTHVRTTLWAPDAVKLRGTGTIGGRFRIAWNHGASLGGRVTTGTVFIR